MLLLNRGSTIICNKICQVCSAYQKLSWDHLPPWREICRLGVHFSSSRTPWLQGHEECNATQNDKTVELIVPKYNKRTLCSSRVLFDKKGLQFPIYVSKYISWEDFWKHLTNTHYPQFKYIYEIWELVVGIFKWFFGLIWKFVLVNLHIQFLSNYMAIFLEISWNCEF